MPRSAARLEVRPGTRLPADDERARVRDLARDRGEGAQERLQPPLLEIPGGDQPDQGLVLLELQFGAQRDAQQGAVLRAESLRIKARIDHLDHLGRDAETAHDVFLHQLGVRGQEFEAALGELERVDLPDGVAGRQRLPMRGLVGGAHAVVQAQQVLPQEVAVAVHHVVPAHRAAGQSGEGAPLHVRAPRPARDVVRVRADGPHGLVVELFGVDVHRPARGGGGPGFLEDQAHGAGEAFHAAGSDGDCISHVSADSTDDRNCC